MLVNSPMVPSLGSAFIKALDGSTNVKEDAKAFVWQNKEWK